MPVMSPAEQYRKIAAQLRADALKTPNGKAAAELDHLARAYVRLAEQAEQNSRVDVWAEFGPKVRLDGDEA